jgi:hypothetical protein
VGRRTRDAASVRQPAASTVLAEDVTARDAADGGVTPMAREQPQPPGHGRWLRLRARAAVVATALGVVAVVLLLPIAARSLLTQLQEMDIAPAYDVVTGTLLDPERQTIAPVDATYANFSISTMDAATRAVTIAVSGNRLCHADCPDVRVTISSLAAPGSLTRGLPPSARFMVPGQTGPIATTFELPVVGDPQRYPFDAYTLILGIATEEKGADGTIVPIRKDRLAATAELTVSNAVGWLEMATPELLDRTPMIAPASSTPYLSVLRLRFTRPVYVQVLTLLLVLLIIASGLVALFLNDLSDLLIGIGSFVLVIWGIRSVVIQGNLPVVTIVDAVLTIVILLRLLGLAIRATLSFWRQAKAARH